MSKLHAGTFNVLCVSAHQNYDYFLKKDFIFIYLNYFTILLRSKESTKMETLQTGH